MSVNALYILNASREVLVEKVWAGSIDFAAINYFILESSKYSGALEVPVVMASPKCYLFHVVRSQCTFVAATVNELPPLFVTSFLHRIANVIQEYVGPLKEENIVDNLLPIYQVLDEIADGGVPFTTESNVLQELIPKPTLVNRMVSAVTGTSGMKETLPEGAVSNIRWRATNPRHTNNEIFFDIVDYIDTTMDYEGRVLKQDVFGEVQTRCHLSGTPDLIVSFSSGSPLQNVLLHPCVRSRRFLQEQVASFVPPDGNFKLFSYRVPAPQHSLMPIYCRPIFSWGEGRGKLSLMAGTRQEMNVTVEAIKVWIYFPPCVKSLDVSCNVGVVQTDETSKVCEWAIGKIPREKVPCLSGAMTLHKGVDVPDSLPSLQASFRAPGLNVSKLKIDKLEVYNERYKPFKGVRYLTEAGKVYIRP
mmetsp:Transcript_11908/g.43572  ORF Transcript_11908/g.43572 Transcript_11908/m.43572 type:complete len:418 (-) Transcript_11908:160-1413(-)